MGSLWASTAWTAWFSDAKVVATIITWLVYLIYLYMRGLGGYRGRRPIYISQLGFASILFAFFIVNYLSAQHGFLYGR
jgi:ABC-type transport system involved in cytochrome c biogenesis permease subunit